MLCFEQDKGKDKNFRWVWRHEIIFRAVKNVRFQVIAAILNECKFGFPKIFYALISFYFYAVKCGAVKKGALILLFFVIAGVVYAQQPDSANVKIGIVQNGDSLVFKNIKEVVVFPDRKFKNKREYRRYSRYVRKVKKVYPLAVEARELLKEYQPKYEALEDRGDQRKLMKQLEKELLAKHKDELRKWSISDGRILLKLINRETERTPYSLIKDFRGGFSATFWQGVAKLFKNDLKTGYNPEEEDKVLEEIVTLIELGYL